MLIPLSLSHPALLFWAKSVNYCGFSLMSSLLSFQVVSASEFVEGFYIYYRNVEQRSKSNEGSYQMLTVLNTGAPTFQIVGLEKFTTYQIFLLPFFKNVEGRPSNYVNVATLQDGEFYEYNNSIATHPFICIYIFNI